MTQNPRPSLCCTLLFSLLPILSGCLETSTASVGPIRDATGPLSTESAPLWKIETEGGKNGRVIEVTTLAPQGPGSLAAALNAKGPRQVVFKVGGTIDLGAREWRINQPYLTVDGASAPEPGITLIRGGLAVATHDVILRHLRVRPGEAGFAKGSGWEIDAIGTTDGARDVIIENCSLSWATDEILTASGPRFKGSTPEEWRAGTSHRILFRHNIIAEGLSHSTHKEPEHSKGMLIHDNVTQVAIIGNLFASNETRNPQFKGGNQAILANNLIYNPGRWAIHSDLIKKEWEGRPPIPSTLALVGNIVQPGPDTPIEMPIGIFLGSTKVYHHDNHFNNPATFNLGVPWIGQYERLQKSPFWLQGFEARPATQTASWVLEKAGARPWSRDAIDKRIIRQVRERGGRIIDSEREVEGYPAN